MLQFVHWSTNNGHMRRPKKIYEREVLEKISFDFQDRNTTKCNIVNANVPVEIDKFKV